MREIKFRAWDKNHKIMYPFELIELPYSENVNLDGQFDGLIERGYVFMQYTGLHDKNGKNIYEGDIVKGNYLKCIGVVKYSEKFCRFQIDDWATITPSDIYEVIGNIYENPELLND